MPSPTKQEAQIQALASVFKALASEVRLDILVRIKGWTPSDALLVPSRRGQDAGIPGPVISRSALRQHLGVLESAGIVGRRPLRGNGAAFEYRIEPEKLQAITRFLAEMAEGMDGARH